MTRAAHFGSRRLALAVLLSVGVSLLAACGASSPKPTSTPGDAGTPKKTLRKVVFTTASNGQNPLFMNVEIGKELGYFAEEGIDPEFQHLGSNAAVLAMLSEGKAQVGVGTSDFQVTTVASGNKLAGVCFYEYAAPMKWDVAVAANSSITSLAQLSGKKLGLISKGTADEHIATNWLKLVGVEPSKVEMTVVGQGAPGGVALTKGDIQAMLAWDTTLGSWDAAKIGYKVLPRPQGLKPVGGFYLQATPKWIQENRDLAVGFARAVAKSTVFALNNLEAASRVYVKMHPEAAGQSMSQSEAVTSIMTAVRRRADHWISEDKNAPLGQMSLDEWKNELEFANVQDKVKDASQFFTNDLIKDANNFDKDAIKKQATAYPKA